MSSIKSCSYMKGVGISLLLLDVGVNIYITNLMTNVHYHLNVLSVKNDYQVDGHL